MILTCPACGTQYMVKDGAIPAEGRKVRCASCGNSWKQLPEGEDGSAAEPVAPAQEPPFGPSSVATEPEEQDGKIPDEPDYPTDDSDSAVDEDRADAAAVAAQAASEAAIPATPAVAPPIDPVVEASAAAPNPPERETVVALETDPGDDFSPFARREPAGRERKAGIIAVLIVLLLVAAAAAAIWMLASDQWRERLGLAAVEETPLQLMMTHSDRQTLESGNELLAVSGRVINPTDETQAVPTIHAELRNASGQLVYRWTIPPPARTLPPHGSASFNSAELNVPAGGEELTVTLGEPRQGQPNA